MTRQAVLVALVLLMAPFAGCLKGEETAAPAQTDQPAANETPSDLPTGVDFKALEETNKTEAGVGGMDHKHDYWQGAETVTIYDYDVTPQIIPVFERGDNSKAFIAFINLNEVPDEPGRAALVYEGTGLVTISITSAPAWATDFQMVFRTAGSDWSTPVQMKLGEAFDYQPAKTETDMPHSFRSLWNWKVQATAPVPVSSDLGVADMPIHVTIVVTKARSVEDWPGHPAFYDGVSERVVVDEKPGQTNVQQAADVLIYGVEPDQVVPDKLISMGTGMLDVYVNITRLELPPGITNAGFSLFWRTANTTPNSLGIWQMNNETDGTTYAYWHLMVEPDMVDSPYQPESRFSFKVLANPANDDLVVCYRCVPYTIEYTMTVIARPTPVAPEATTEPVK